MDRLSELPGHHVQFAYTAWDRIVLTGYIDQLQRPERLVGYFRDVLGVTSVTPEVLMSRTGPPRAGSRATVESTRSRCSLPPKGSAMRRPSTLSRTLTAVNWLN